MSQSIFLEFFLEGLEFVAQQTTLVNGEKVCLPGIQIVVDVSCFKAHMRLSLDYYFSRRGLGVEWRVFECEATNRKAKILYDFVLDFRNLALLDELCVFVRGIDHDSSAAELLD